MSVKILSHDLSAYNKTQQTVLNALLGRFSAWPLIDPAPSADELALVFEIAMRAPDHGHLKPWRFVTIQEQAREKLADVFEQASLQMDPQADAKRLRAKALAAPLIVALGVHITPVRKVPAQEQALTVGAATMNMLNALQTLGYGGFWGSGLHTYHPYVKDSLGFEQEDQLIGFLYIGTPQTYQEAPLRPEINNFVRNWPEEK